MSASDCKRPADIVMAMGQSAPIPAVKTSLVARRRYAKIRREGILEYELLPIRGRQRHLFDPVF